MKKDMIKFLTGKVAIAIVYWIAIFVAYGWIVIEKKNAAIITLILAFVYDFSAHQVRP